MGLHLDSFSRNTELKFVNHFSGFSVRSRECAVAFWAHKILLNLLSTLFVFSVWCRTILSTRNCNKYFCIISSASNATAYSLLPIKKTTKVVRKYKFYVYVSYVLYENLENADISLESIILKFVFLDK